MTPTSATPPPGPPDRRVRPDTSERQARSAAIVAAAAAKREAERASSRSEKPPRSRPEPAPTDDRRAARLAAKIEASPRAGRRLAGSRARGVTSTLVPTAGEVALPIFRVESTVAATLAAGSFVFVIADPHAVDSLGAQAGEWLCSSLAARLPLAVACLQLPTTVADAAAAARAALAAAAAAASGTPEQPAGTVSCAIVGIGAATGLALELARSSDHGRMQGESLPHIERLALLTPGIRSPHTPAELAGLPPTLLQSSPVQPGSQFAAQLREAGVGVREIAYAAAAGEWSLYPKAVSTAARALDDLSTFLRRGIVDDGFDVVPAWNLH